MSIHLSHYRQRLHLQPPQVEGRVTQVVGMLIEGQGKDAAVGDLYRIAGRHDDILAEVVALKENHVVLMPFGQVAGLRVGARMTPEGNGATFAVGEALCGRVVDVFGRPLDGKPAPQLRERRSIYASPLSPMERRPIKERMTLGVRALDAFVPCGIGQRLGIFAGSGVGKSTLMGMIARSTAADVVVLALVGERGREVRHFVDEILGPEGLKKTVVVVATSDRPSPERLRAAYVATTIAEHFRDEGKSVLLFVDSLTRLCMAQREIGLAVGEPPATKGYPPSAFAFLPKLLERAAASQTGGSVTGIYTVLVEGDDVQEPVADTARGLLDGHIVLTRRLAERGHFPAIDPLQSLSRLESDLLSTEELRAARLVRGWLSKLEDARDLISIGAYRAGADPELDVALRQKTVVEGFLKQEFGQTPNLQVTKQHLLNLTRDVEKRT